MYICEEEVISLLNDRKGVPQGSRFGPPGLINNNTTFSGCLYVLHAKKTIVQQSYEVRYVKAAGYIQVKL